MSDFVNDFEKTGTLLRQFIIKNIGERISVVSRTGLGRSRHGGRASFANIYVLGKYTRRATKSEKG